MFEKKIQKLQDELKEFLPDEFNDIPYLIWVERERIYEILSQIKATEIKARKNFEWRRDK